MNKNRVNLLITFNILLSVFLGYMVFGNGFLMLVSLSVGSLLHHYLPTVLMLSFIICNLWSAYSLYKDKSKFRLCLMLTLHTIFWFLLLFIGYFFASNLLFPLISSALTIWLFYKLKNFSSKLGLRLTVVTVIVILLAIIFSFEENYCWNKGKEVDPTGSKAITVTNQEDKEIAKDYGLELDQPVGIAFLAHMKCHKNFDLIKAIQEKYLFIK